MVTVYETPDKRCRVRLTISFVRAPFCVRPVLIFCSIVAVVSVKGTGWIAVRDNPYSVRLISRVEQKQDGIVPSV